MVYTIPTFDLGSAFGGGLGQGISSALGQLGQQQMQQQEAARLQQALSGLSPEQLEDPIQLFSALAERPDIAQAIQKGQVEREKTQAGSRKFQQDQELEQRDYGIIKNTFGEKFANIWRSAPQGGRTELVRTGMDALLRGDNLNELLKGVNEPEKLSKPTAIESNIPKEIPQMENGNLPKNFEYPDFSKRPEGFTPKEWRNEQKGWRKENVPLFEENKKRLLNTNRDKLSTKNLETLNKSKKLPEDFARVIIDPNTGEIRPLAQLLGSASPEAQQWVKEIARFQNRAKDAYGARVTNFDLQSYMKQFPNLLNTPEGRARIIEMMKINYELDELYQNALDKVYKKYGLGNIPQESADELAQGMIKDRKRQLESEYLRVSEGMELVTQLKNTGYDKGDSARDPETGEQFIFNGSEWEKVE